MRRRIVVAVLGGALATGVALPSGSTPLAPAAAETAVTAQQAPYRILSSPDFLNTDVADLDYWRPDRGKNAPNSTNPHYENALDAVLEDWKSWDPGAVLVAGDLVEGRWGQDWLTKDPQDTRKTGNFGPTRTYEQKRQHIRNAATTYFGAWAARLRDHGLPNFHVAVGDHDLGDNPWSGNGRGKLKRDARNDFRRIFARKLTKTTSGSPRYADRPKGTAKEFTAYAFRPRSDIQIVTLDVFSTNARGTDIVPEVDERQLHWLRGVLAKANRDGVEWIIVQGHTPILGPVRARGSSQLMYENVRSLAQGRNTALWKVFKNHGVDVYLSGEVHDTTQITRDGVTQISHGGIFGFGTTNYLVADVTDDRISFRHYSYDVTLPSKTAPRLWESQKHGRPPWKIGYGGRKLTGSLVKYADGSTSRGQGRLTPCGADDDCEFPKD